MKTPRFQLREAVVAEILRDFSPGRFFEIGHGDGSMLFSLAQRGWEGEGYDFSADARAEAREKMKSSSIRNVRILEALPKELPAGRRFDLVVFFEVIGYWADPVATLEGLRSLLNPGGKIIFSFTRSGKREISEKLTGEMRCFTRDEITGLLKKAGFRSERTVNYGFPLINLLRPALDAYHLLRSKKNLEANQAQRIKKSYRVSDRWVMRLVAFGLNPVTMAPFVWIQRYFSRTDRGNGYVVVAVPEHS